MKKRKSKFKFDFVIRYLLMILIAIPDLFIFYAVFTPLTVYPVYFIIKLFFSASLSSNVILINNRIPIELIKACIAGAAYYLLFIFNLSIPNIKFEKRIKMIVLSFLSLLILNIFRIIFLIFIYVSSNASFNTIHLIFWYALSTIFVIGIWFAEVKIYKIKGIPIYSDIKYLLKIIKK